MIGRNPLAASDCCRYDRCEFAIGGGLPGNEASASMLPLQRSMVRKRPARANTRSHRIELMPAHSHRISGSSFASPTNGPHRVAAGVAVVVAAFVISALVNRFVARRAERNNPPTGKFVEVGALRLHYTEQGQGPPLVLLHGNSGMIQDFTSSGLIDKAVKRSSRVEWRRRASRFFKFPSSADRAASRPSTSPRSSRVAASRAIVTRLSFTTRAASPAS
jgi:hypothetical protein